MKEDFLHYVWQHRHYDFLNAKTTDGKQVNVVFPGFHNFDAGPDFLQAAKSAEAIPLYEYFLRRCRERGFAVETGEFGAEMLVESVNDGPVTLILDTDTL